METIVCRDSLIAALVAYGRVAPKKSTMPILTQARIDVLADGSCTVTATNLDMAVTTAVLTVTEQPHESGAICVDGRILLQWLKLQPKRDHIRLDAMAETLMVSSLTTGASAHLVGKSTGEYPTAQTVPDEGATVTWFEMDANTLRDLAKQTFYSASQDSARPIFTTAYFQLTPENGQVKVATADSYRLTRYCTEVQMLTADAAPITFLVPVVCLSKLVALLPKQATVMLGVTPDLGAPGQRLFVRVGEMTWSMNCLSGTYPNYEAVIPTHFVDIRIFDRAALLFMCKQLRALYPDAETMRLSLADYDTLGVEFPIDQADTYDGRSIPCETVEIAYNAPEQVYFNPVYLMDFLTACEDARVWWSCPRADGGQLFEGVPAEGASHVTHVVMSMHKTR